VLEYFLLLLNNTFQYYHNSFRITHTTTITMASSNPSNFANLPKDELREIAAKGGHASHGGAHTGDVRVTSGYRKRVC
jgi:hypothetical protein